MLRLGIVASHPIQYQSPLFRCLADRAVVDIEVLYLSRGPAGGYDPGFGRHVEWDLDLLEGFSSSFAPTHGPSVRYLRRWMRAQRVDVVLVHGYADAGMVKAAVAARSLGLEYLLRGESHVEGYTRGAKRLLRDALARLAVRNAAVGLSIGTRNDEFYEHFGARRTVRSPYSVDTARFATVADEVRADPVERADRLRSFGLSPDAPVLVFSGKLQSWKRPGDAVAAIAALDGAVSLLVVGDGPLRPSLEERAEGLPVAFAGFVNQSEIPEVYALGDALVLPSDREPWGLVVNEGMACGLLPIVSDRVGCASDLVEGVGSVYPCGVVPALSAAVRRHLLAGSPDRSLIASRLSEFTIERSAEGIEAAVTSAL